MRYINHRIYISPSHSQRYRLLHRNNVLHYQDFLVYTLFLIFQLFVGGYHISICFKRFVKKLTQQFFHAAEEHQTKCQVWFAYLLPISNTKHEHMDLTICNVCNNTEINIKKRCYTKQVYIISNFSIILFSIKGNAFSSELATWLLLSFLYTSPLWYNNKDDNTT